MTLYSTIEAVCDLFLKEANKKQWKKLAENEIKVGDIVEFTNLKVNTVWKVISDKKEKSPGAIYGWEPKETRRRILLISPYDPHYKEFVDEIWVLGSEVLKTPTPPWMTKSDEQIKHMQNISDYYYRKKWVPETQLKKVDWVAPEIKSYEKELSNESLGKTYTVEDSLGKVHKISIVNDEEESKQNNMFSINGPYGQAFANKTEGDEVEVKLGSGFKTFYILEIK